MAGKTVYPYRSTGANLKSWKLHTRYISLQQSGTMYLYIHIEISISLYTYTDIYVYTVVAKCSFKTMACGWSETLHLSVLFKNVPGKQSYVDTRWTHEPIGEIGYCDAWMAHLLVLISPAANFPMLHQKHAPGTIAFSKKHGLEPQRETPNPASFMCKAAKSKTTL